MPVVKESGSAEHVAERSNFNRSQLHMPLQEAGVSCQDRLFPCGLWQEVSVYFNMRTPMFLHRHVYYCLGSVSRTQKNPIQYEDHPISQDLSVLRFQQPKKVLLKKTSIATCPVQIPVFVQVPLCSVYFRTTCFFDDTHLKYQRLTPQPPL